jgi:hypothetical protein
MHYFHFCNLPSQKGDDGVNCYELCSLRVDLHAARERPVWVASSEDMITPSAAAAIRPVSSDIRPCAEQLNIERLRQSATDFIGSLRPISPCPDGVRIREAKPCMPAAPIAAIGLALWIVLQVLRRVSFVGKDAAYGVQGADAVAFAANMQERDGELQLADFGTGMDIGGARKAVRARSPIFRLEGRPDILREMKDS